MPIRKSERARYPANWEEIRARVVKRSGGRCECDGRCGREHRFDFIVGAARCPEFFGTPSATMKKPVRVQAQIAHLDQIPEHCQEENLMAMCQACHLAYDAHAHLRNGWETKQAQRRDRGYGDQGSGGSGGYGGGGSGYGD